MAATEATAPRPSGAISPGFVDQRRLDSNFFLLLVALIWLGILMGFVPDINRHVQAQKPFPVVVYFHGVMFVAWLVLLTAQILLIRVRKPTIHRELGMAGVALYGAMIVLGVTTSVAVDYYEFPTPQGDPQFLSIQLGDMVNFLVLGGAAIALRTSPDAHKRLMLLTTFCIADAGFARWWGSGLQRLLGDGYWGNWAQLYLSDFLLIVLLGAYDLFTRRRLFPAYVRGAAFGLVLQFAAIWLYVSSWWKPVAITLIGR